MEIIKYAFETLRIDFKRTVKSYFLYQVLTVVILFIFSHFVGSDNLLATHLEDYKTVYIRVGAELSAEYPITNMLSFAIVAMIIALGFYAYSYLLNHQNDKLAIFKLSGTNKLKIVLYQLAYLFIIVAMAVLIGVPIGLIGLEIIYRSVFFLSEVDYVGFHFSFIAMRDFIVLLITQIVYLVVITIGYIHKSQIKHLVYGAKSLSIVNNKKKEKRFILSLIIVVFGFIVSIYGMMNSTSSFEFGEMFLMGAVGIFLCTKRFINVLIVRFIDYIKKKQAVKHNNLYVGLAMLRSDLINTSNVVFFLTIMMHFCFCSVLLSNQNVSDLGITMAIYFFGTLVLCITIGYQMLMNTEGRRKDFIQLYNLGKTKKDLESVLKFEIYACILVTFIMSTFYPMVLTILGFIYQTIEVKMTLLLYLIYSVILGIVAIYVYKVFKKKVLS